MRQSKQTAVGRYAARGKQYIVQLRPVAGGLVMQQLLYAPEVRSIDDVDIPEAPVRDAELTLARQLISQISSPTFDPTKYQDEVKQRIETAIEKKLEGQEIAISPSVPEAGGQVIDLMEALKASLAKTTRSARREGCRRRTRGPGGAQGRAEEDAEEGRRSRRGRSTRAEAQGRQAFVMA
jgi:DNA end-binding protein Ku